MEGEDEGGPDNDELEPEDEEDVEEEGDMEYAEDKEDKEEVEVKDEGDFFFFFFFIVTSPRIRHPAWRGPPYRAASMYNEVT